jgi:hypothetical protein
VRGEWRHQVRNGRGGQRHAYAELALNSEKQPKTTKNRGALEWYAGRWSIETFFRTLKTGCRIEDIRLTTADRLANCIALACITAWRIFWMTMLRRAEPAGAPAAVFTDTELALLDSTKVTTKSGQTRDLDFYLTAVAKLGGYLARKHDAPPGTTVLWRGFSRLADLVIGFEAAQTSPNGQTCG